MKVILLGPPGAGKGTQAQYIQNKYNIPQISTGDILRSNIKNKTQIGLQVKKIINEGKLVPDNIIINMIIERLRKEDCSRGFLLDGFPRTIEQANALQTVNINIDFVIEIKVPDQDIINRITGRRIHEPSGRVYHISYNPPINEGLDDTTSEPLIQRKDDSIEIVKNRLNIYHKTTALLADYYQKITLNGDEGHKTKYFKINGSNSVKQVKQDIEKILTIRD